MVAALGYCRDFLAIMWEQIEETNPGICTCMQQSNTEHFSHNWRGKISILVSVIFRTTKVEISSSSQFTYWKLFTVMFTLKIPKLTQLLTMGERFHRKVHNRVKRRKLSEENLWPFAEYASQHPFSLRHLGASLIVFLITGMNIVCLQIKDSKLEGFLEISTLFYSIETVGDDILEYILLNL